jgi:hypothetical protein
MQSNKIGRVFPLLYDALKGCVSICFNTLNVLLGGKLPPFGSVAVIAEEQNQYLVVKLPGERVVFPGGFIQWRETPRKRYSGKGRRRQASSYTSVTCSAVTPVWVTPGPA